MHNSLLAHAGEAHQTATEAAAHTGPQVFFTAFIITLLVAAFLVAGTYAIKRIAKVEITNEEHKEQ